MKKMTARAANSFLVVLAAIFVAPACVMFWHSPEVPAELLEK